MTFRSVLKTTIKIFLGLFLLAALFLAWVMFVNRNDEPLTPEAQALLSYRAEEALDMENGYVALTGFTAPAGSDWKKAGAEQLRRPNEALERGWHEEKNSGAAEEKLEFVGGNDKDSLLKLSRNFSDAELQASLRELPQQAEKIESLLKDNAELVERYKSMLALPAFREPRSASIFMPHFPNFASETRKVRNLLFAETSLAALEGDVRPLLDFLEQDMRFWRRAMRSDTVLITAFVVQSPLMDDIRLLRALLPQIDISNPETVERLRALLTPLSPAERSLGRVYENEWHGQALFYMNMEEENRKTCEYASSFMEEKIDCHPFGTDFFTRWTYQPQATLNRYALHIVRVRGLLQLTPKEFIQRSSSGMNGQKGESEENLWEWLNPYNFTGRILADIASPTLSVGDYVSYRYDLAAALQLVRAQLELRLAGIDAEKNPQAVPEFLAQAGEETRNPYTEAPFVWDENCLRLSFTPQEVYRRVFFEITLADIPEQNAAACTKSVQE